MWRGYRSASGAISPVIELSPASWPEKVAPKPETTPFVRLSRHRGRPTPSGPGLVSRTVERPSQPKGRSKPAAEKEHVSALASEPLPSG